MSRVCATSKKPYLNIRLWNHSLSEDCYHCMAAFGIDNPYAASILRVYMGKLVISNFIRHVMPSEGESSSRMWGDPRHLVMTFVVPRWAN